MVLAVALSGCVTELLQETDETTRNLTCAVLNGPVWVHGHASQRDLEPALAATVAALSVGLEKDPEAFTVDVVPLEWDPAIEDLVTWAARLVRLDDAGAHVHVVGVPDLDEDVVQLVAPGVVVVSEAAMGSPMITRALVLHGVGHALGVVNAGTPFNGTATSGREAPMHHEPSPRSVMHAGWHHVDTMPKTNATYDRYSDAVHDDWRGARGSICT